MVLPEAISLASSAALISAKRLLGFFKTFFLTFASSIPVFVAFSSVGRKAPPDESLEGDLKIEARDLALDFALPGAGGGGGWDPCEIPVFTSLRASLGYLTVELEAALAAAAAVLETTLWPDRVLSLVTAGPSLGYLTVSKVACRMDAATEGSLDFDLALALTCAGSPLGYLTVSEELFLARALPRPSAIIMGTGSSSESGIAASGCNIPVVHGMLLALALTLLERGLLVDLGVPMSKLWTAAAAVGTVGITRGAPPKPGGGGCGGSPPLVTIIALGSLFLLKIGFLVILETAPADGGGPGGGCPE